jgi:CubicO group peptidase (beta-lactamase class C family)
MYHDGADEVRPSEGASTPNEGAAVKHIDKKYKELGGTKGFLGVSEAPAAMCPDQFGWFQHFKGGSIYFHPDTGAHAVYGEIFKKWAALGWENSWLGYPVGDEEPHGEGRVSRFQNGRIEWNESGGARDLEGVGCRVHFESTPEAFKELCDEYVATGWRLISASVCGSTTRIASVWTSHAGPEQRVELFTSVSSYQQWDKQNLEDHFATTQLSVRPLAGAISAELALVVAAADEVVSPSRAPVSHVRLKVNGKAGSTTSLSYWLNWAQQNEFIPASLDLYSAKGTLYAALVLAANDDQVAWNSSGVVQRHATLKRDYDLHTKHGERLALQTHEQDGLRLAVYRDDHVGFWIAKSDLSLSKARAATDQLAKEGKYPVSLSVNDSGRFTIIFASRKDPLPNRWAITGKEVPQLAAVEAVIKDYMVKHNIRCGTVAVGKDARLAYARAFTWAPPTYPIARPQHIFRIGSCTKVFPAMAIHQLIDEDKLALDDKVLDVLDIEKSFMPFGGLAPGTKGIDVRQLLNHTSGLADRDTNVDRDDVADGANVSFAKTTKADCVRHLIGFPLKEPAYTNNGYVAAGAVLEAVEKTHGNKRTTFASVKARILDPLGLTRPAVSGWALKKAAPWSVHQHTAVLDVVHNVVANDGSVTRAGYENYHPGHGEGCGSFAFSAADVIKVLTSFSCGANNNPILTPAAVDRMWPPGDKLNGFLQGGPAPAGYDRVLWHNGAVSGGHGIFVLLRKGAGEAGVSIASFFNKDAPAAPMPYWDELIGGIASWPSHDLFESVGIPPHS